MVTVKTKSTKDTLCKYCQNDFATCSAKCNLKFGNGKGNDNIIQCDCFVVKSFHNTYPIKAV